jgi:hypothetical protein
MREPYSFTFYVASWYRKSPYWQRTVEAGCTSWDLYNHMLIPTLYDDDEAEYRHLLEHVTLWYVAVERQVGKGMEYVVAVVDGKVSKVTTNTPAFA